MQVHPYPTAPYPPNSQDSNSSNTSTSSTPLNPPKRTFFPVFKLPTNLHEERVYQPKNSMYQAFKLSGIGFFLGGLNSAWKILTPQLPKPLSSGHADLKGLPTPFDVTSERPSNAMKSAILDNFKQKPTNSKIQNQVVWRPTLVQSPGGWIDLIRGENGKMWLFLTVAPFVYGYVESSLSNAMASPEPTFTSAAFAGCAAGFLNGIRKNSLTSAVGTCAFTGSVMGIANVAMPKSFSLTKLETVPETRDERLRRMGVTIRLPPPTLSSDNM